MKHSNWPSNPGDIVNTVHATIPDFVILSIDLQHFIPVECNIEVGIQIHLIYGGLITECEFQSLVLHFSDVGERGGKSGNHRNFKDRKEHTSELQSLMRISYAVL